MNDKNFKARGHLLQQVVVDMPPDRVPFEVKVDVHVLSKPTGIIISVRLGVTKSFEDDIGLHQHVLDSKTYQYLYLSLEPYTTLMLITV